MLLESAHDEYVVCALVSPRLDGEDGMDMHVFHQQQGKAYIGGIAALAVFAIATNVLGGRGIDVTQWIRENAFVIATLPIVIAPLIWRTAWVQIVAPILLIALIVAEIATVHPVLA
jgi:hypothetical protein